MSFDFLVCKVRVFVSMSIAPFYFIYSLNYVAFETFMLKHFALSHWLSSSRSDQKCWLCSLCEIQQASEPWYQTSVRWSLLVGFLITLQWFCPCGKATEMNSPWVSVGGGPRNILDNQNELRCLFYQAIKNISVPWVLCRAMQLDTHFTHKSFPPWLAAAAERSSSLWVISCQAMYLNILHPAQFKVQVSP